LAFIVGLFIIGNAQLKLLFAVTADLPGESESQHAAAPILPQQQQQQQHSQPSQPLVVAYAVSITDCSKSVNSITDVLDAASVLQHSIHLSSIRTISSGSVFDYQMYAFIHQDAKTNCTSIIQELQDIEYRIQYHPTPFSLDDVIITDERAAFWKEKIVNQGCCGEREMIKLYTLQLNEHPIAIHLDLDTLIFRPLDHLFYAMLDPTNHTARRLVQNHQQQHYEEQQVPVPQNILSYFTRDYNMAVPGIKPNRVLMQGGFWIVRPSVMTFHDLVSVLEDHAHRFSPKCGWGGCELGNARLYGGAGFQGLISYYYTFVQGGRDPTLALLSSSSSSSSSSRPASANVTHLNNASHFVELNRCLYNSMADKPRKACAKGETHACSNCNHVPLRDVYGAHFTLCQKPWKSCRGVVAVVNADNERSLCGPFHQAWHAIRKDFEATQTLKRGTTATEKNYTSYSLAYTRRCSAKRKKRKSLIEK